MQSQPLRERQGTSVVEILVALAIFSVGIYALYGQFLNLSNQSRRQALSSQAQLLAQQELEQLRAADFEALAQWEPAAEARAYSERPNLFRKLSVEPLDANRIELVVQVGWNLSENETMGPGNSVRLAGVKVR